MFRFLSRFRHPHRAVEAERELQRSRELRRQTIEAVRPLVELHERNRFSDMIRDALVTGYGKGGGR